MKNQQGFFLAQVVRAEFRRPTPVPAPRELTIEEVNANPMRFMGQTLTFERVDLLPPVTTGAVRYRFTVRTPGGKVFKADRNSDQEVLFVSQNKDTNTKNFVESLKPDTIYKVTLTVQIQNDKKGALAVIQRVGNLYYRGD